MKKFLNTIFFLGFLLSLNAQTYPVNVSGTVTSNSGGTVEGAYLMVSITPNNTSGFSYFNLVQTNASGVYADQIDVPETSPQGFVSVALIDCDSNSVTQTATFGMGNANNFTMDFDFCGNPPVNTCDAWLSVQYIPGTTLAVLSVQATGTAPFTYFWNNAAGGSQPVDTVSQPGTYCVVVWDADGCSTSACATVVAGNPTADCSVQVYQDTVGSGIGFTAWPTGTAPFTYLWSSGETTQSAAGITPTTPPCVTVTDAVGCTVTGCYTPPPPFCQVYIVGTNTGGLAAVTSGDGPFSYAWSTGEAGPNIEPATPGNYCVTVTSVNNCSAVGCYQLTGSGGGDSCSVFITSALTNPGTVGWTLTANAIGTAPFTYQWNVQNWQTQSITVPGTGTYCVTVTDATGCESMDCITITTSVCSVTIVQGDSLGVSILGANAQGSGQFSYLWSNGGTSPIIFPTSSGNYCVTVTGNNGCTATACYQYFAPIVPNNFAIQGYVYPWDSINSIVNFTGIAELFLLDNATGTFTLVSETPLTNTAGGWLSEYSFSQLAAGQYIIRVSLDPSDPNFEEYLPTYHTAALLWNEAALITVPNTGGFYNTTLLDAPGFAGGSGNIGGTVLEGEGFTSHGSGDRDGAPIEGASILLFNQQETALTHALTDANGQYSFSNLAYGTYKVMIEIPGKEQAFYWITLSADHPASLDNNFNVSENGVTTGLAEAITGAGKLTVFPNPASDKAALFVETNTAAEAVLTMTSTTGTMVFSNEMSLVKGAQQIEISLKDIPSGLYFLNLTDGRAVYAAKIIVK